MFRKLKSLVITLVATAAFVYVLSFFNPIYHEVNPERRATHSITFVQVNEESGEKKTIATCTATAVGPEALLTATHCIEGANDTVMIDLSPIIYHVNAAITDGRDHVILHVIGAGFKNTVHIKERLARLGEPVYMYGDGGGDYPPHALHGRVITDDYEGDLSDADQYVGTACYSLHVVPGDSGSAVYGADGSIVGLVSLGRGASAHPFDYTTGFALGFSPEIIATVSQ